MKAAGLWWAVLLATLVANLCYGPWNGAGWYEKLCGSAQEYLVVEAPHNPLFSWLYPRVCKDTG
eukprot:3624803-Lingulodinium_polyedra.AAC.1